MGKSVPQLPVQETSLAQGMGLIVLLAKRQTDNVVTGFKNRLRDNRVWAQDSNQ